MTVLGDAISEAAYATYTDEGLAQEARDLLNQMLERIDVLRMRGYHTSIVQLPEKPAHYRLSISRTVVL